MTGPRVLTVVSCAETKQDLPAGVAVPARELYTSSVHTCKDRYGRHSDGYYIASAEYGLVHHETELPEYDRTLSDMSDVAVAAWARDVAKSLDCVVIREDFDAVVIIGGREYADPLAEHFASMYPNIIRESTSHPRPFGAGVVALKRRGTSSPSSGTPSARTRDISEIRGDSHENVLQII